MQLKFKFHSNLSSMQQNGVVRQYYEIAGKAPSVSTLCGGPPLTKSQRRFSGT